MFECSRHTFHFHQILRYGTDFNIIRVFWSFHASVRTVENAAHQAMRKLYSDWKTESPNTLGMVAAQSVTKMIDALNWFSVEFFVHCSWLFIFLQMMLEDSEPLCEVTNGNFKRMLHVISQPGWNSVCTKCRTKSKYFFPGKLYFDTVTCFYATIVQIVWTDWFKIVLYVICKLRNTSPYSFLGWEKLAHIKESNNEYCCPS